MNKEFDKQMKLWTNIKDPDNPKFFMRYRKQTESGFIWEEQELFQVPEVIGIDKAEDLDGKPTVNIRVYGELKKEF